MPYNATVLLSGSSVTLCRTTDQRGVHSATGKACSSGAVQFGWQIDNRSPSRGLGNACRTSRLGPADAPELQGELQDPLRTQNHGSCVHHEHTKPHRHLPGIFLSGWPDLNRRPLDPQFCPGHFPSDTSGDNSLLIVPSTRDFIRTDTTASNHPLPPFSGFSGAMVLTAVLTDALSEAVRARYRRGEIVSRQT